MDAANTAAPVKLDVARVLLAAAVAPLFHKRTLVRFALPVVAAEVAKSLATGLVMNFLDFVSIGAVLVLTVACHRVFVLGPRSTAGHDFQWWTRRVAQFFGWGLVVGFICAIVATPAIVYLVIDAAASDQLPAGPAAFSARSQLVSLVLALPALYVFSRLSLVLPAVATVDAPGDLGKAWELSSGNGLRLALVVGLFPALFDTLSGVLLSGESPLIQTVRTLVAVYVLLVQIAALSMAYRELTQLTPPR